MISIKYATELALDNFRTILTNCKFCNLPQVTACLKCLIPLCKDHIANPLEDGKLMCVRCYHSE